MQGTSAHQQQQPLPTAARPATDDDNSCPYDTVEEVLDALLKGQIDTKKAQDFRTAIESRPPKVKRTAPDTHDEEESELVKKVRRVNKYFDKSVLPAVRPSRLLPFCMLIAGSITVAAPSPPFKFFSQWAFTRV